MSTASVISSSFRDDLRRLFSKFKVEWKAGGSFSVVGDKPDSFAEFYHGLEKTVFSIIAQKLPPEEIVRRIIRGALEGRDQTSL